MIKSNSLILKLMDKILGTLHYTLINISIETINLFTMTSYDYFNTNLLQLYIDTTSPPSQIWLFCLRIFLLIVIDS